MAQNCLWSNDFHGIVEATVMAASSNRIVLENDVFCGSGKERQIELCHWDLCLNHAHEVYAKTNLPMLAQHCLVTSAQVCTCIPIWDLGIRIHPQHVGKKLLQWFWSIEVSHKWGPQTLMGIPVQWKPCGKRTRFLQSLWKAVANSTCTTTMHLLCTQRPL